ncbi:hypothetical protein FOA52_014496 [Chlamydomonas sp. UWO 241]|nr:hypothetical protein FOA52_014496 [Chlamydomonas sp. UWO 241]
MIKLIKNARNVPDDVNSAGDVSPKSCKNKAETTVGWISVSSTYTRSSSGAVQGDYVFLVLPGCSCQCA